MDDDWGDADSWQQVSCPICGPAKRVPYRAFGRFRLVKCADCGLVFLNPRPSQETIATAYATDSYFKAGGRRCGYADCERNAPGLKRTFARRLDRIADAVSPPGRLLDVGCGMGYLLEVACARGWECWGVDPSPYCHERLAARFGDRVLLGRLDQVELPPHSFDLVVLFDVLEHLYWPSRALEQIARLVRPSGHVLITTPNIRSLLALITGRRWVSFKLPEHVFYYEPSTIQQLAAPWFDVLDIRPAGQYVSLRFAMNRLAWLVPATEPWLRRLLPDTALAERLVYVTSGSLTALLRQRTG